MNQPTAVVTAPLLPSPSGSITYLFSPPPPPGQTFHRRIYRLLNKDSDVVLLHYLNDADENAVTPRPSTSAERSAPKSKPSRPRAPPLPPAPVLLPLKMEDLASPEPGGKHEEDEEERTSRRLALQHEREATEAADLSAEGGLSLSSEEDLLMVIDSFLDFPPAPDDAFREVPLPVSPSPDLGASSFPPAVPVPFGYPSSPYLVEGDQPVLPPPSFDPVGHCCSSYPQHDHYARALPEGHGMAQDDQAIFIEDFSPGWDTVMGGAKLLICLSRPLPPHLTLPDQRHSSLRCAVGPLSIPAEVVNFHVLRCVVPAAHTAGAVHLRIETAAGLPVTPYSVQPFLFTVQPTLPGIGFSTHPPVASSPNRERGCASKRRYCGLEEGNNRSPQEPQPGTPTGVGTLSMHEATGRTK